MTATRAVAVARRQGAPGLSLRAAAELAGVSHAAPYRHFRDKNARTAGQEAFAVLHDLIVEGIQDGHLRPGDPDQLALAAWSVVHGLGLLRGIQAPRDK